MGVRLIEIGRIIQNEAQKGGYKVITNLCSHGIGRSLHKTPENILPIYDKHDKRVLKEGMVITVEPFINWSKYTVGSPDGWTFYVSPIIVFVHNMSTQ